MSAWTRTTRRWRGRRGTERCGCDASWNGRTDVASWEVLAGPDPDHLSKVAGRPWSGLETAIRLETPPAAVAVRALDANGDELGVSETLTS